MSSIMRRRNGLIAWSVMGRLLSGVRVATPHLQTGRASYLSPHRAIGGGALPRERFSPLTQRGHDDPQKILRYPPPDPSQEPKEPDYDVVPIVELEWRSDMREKLGHPLDCNCLGRRNFLKVAGAATVAGITGGSLLLGDRARADARTREQRDRG